MEWRMTVQAPSAADATTGLIRKAVGQVCRETELFVIGRPKNGCSIVSLASMRHLQRRLCLLANKRWMHPCPLTRSLPPRRNTSLLHHTQTRAGQRMAQCLLAGPDG